MDQAAGLRRLLAPRALRVLPLASTLGREAQAALAVGLGAALERSGRRVVVVDASRGGVAAHCGLRPRYELLQLLEGDKRFSEVALEATDGLRVVPGARGIEAMEHADDAGWTELLAAFGALEDAADTVLLNCAPHDVASACRVARGAGEVLVALAEHPESVTGAYALVKSALRRHGQRRFRLIFVGSGGRSDTRQLAARMALAARRFLGVELAFGAALARDAGTQSFTELAAASIGWPLAEVALSA